MKIISWNVASIRALARKKTMHDQNILAEFLQRTRPQIFCIQETKLSKPTEKTEQMLRDMVPGFRYRYYETSEKPGYSGVAVWSKVKPLAVHRGIGATADNEGRTLTIEFEDFVLITVYTPNSGQRLQRLKYRTKSWDQSFRDHVISWMKRKPVIVTGDLNCARTELDLANAKRNEKIAGYTPEERKQLELLLTTTGLIDSFRFLHPNTRRYSYWNYRTRARQRNAGWRIDYFLVDPRIKFKRSTILDQQMGSDHAPVQLSI